MPRVLLTDLNGPVGPTGPVNPESAPTEEALVEWVETAGASAFQTALDSRFGRMDEVRFDASLAANGPITVMDSGQPAAIFGDVDLHIVSGKIVQPTLAEAGVGGYLEVPLDGKLTHIGATFEYTNTTSGCVVLVAPSASWDTGGVVSAGVHFGIYRTTWAFTVFDIATGGEHIIAEGVHTLPINTVLDVDIYVQGTRAAIVLPGGKTFYADDPRIGSLTGNFAIWETFEVDGVTQAPPRILKLRAGSTPGRPASKAEIEVSRVQNDPRAKTVAAAVNWDIPTTEANVASHAFDLPFVWPSSGRVLVTWSVFIELVGTDNILIRPRAASVDGGRQGVRRTASAGTMTAAWVLEGGTAGAMDTVTWEALRSGGATTAKVRCGSDYGISTVSVTPLAAL